MSGIRYKGQIFSGAASFGSADDVSYDNTQSGLTATDVQGAVDEVVGMIPSPTKGDVITYTVNKADVSISANSFADVSIPFSIPTGYTNIGIMRATFSSSWCVPFNAYISGSNVVVSIRNYSSGASSGTAYVIFLIKKN